MDALNAALGLEPGLLPKLLFEANLLLLFGICLIHSLSTHGWARTLREFIGGFALTTCAESAGVLSGAYVYPGFQFYILATPVGNPAAWVALVYIIMAVSDRIVFGQHALHTDSSTLIRQGSFLKTLAILALCDATLALAMDLVLDPLATIYNWWIWVPSVAGTHTIGAGVVDPYNFDHLVWMVTPENPLADFFAPFFEGGFRYPTRVLGIPLINFIAWFVFVLVFTSQFRFVESRKDWSQWKRTWVLWSIIALDIPILSFALISPNI